MVKHWIYINYLNYIFPLWKSSGVVYKDNFQSFTNHLVNFSAYDHWLFKILYNSGFITEEDEKTVSMHIYFLFTIRHIFPKIIMSQISLFKSPENKRRKQQKCLSLYITWHIRNTFDIQKKNISFDYSSHLSTSLCIKRQLDRYSVFFSSCYLFCICRIYCCK